MIILTACQKRVIYKPQTIKPDCDWEEIEVIEYTVFAQADAKIYDGIGFPDAVKLLKCIRMFQEI
jgi:hypothetical protein